MYLHISFINKIGKQMKEIREKYSDHDHYPALKGYYTAISVFFDSCRNPDDFDGNSWENPYYEI